MSFMTLEEATRWIPRRFSAATIWRWIRYGLTTSSGTVVKLRHLQIGRRMFTTAAWLQEFFDALTAAADQAFQGRSKRRPQRKTRKTRKTRRTATRQRRLARYA
ncbi:MAG: hypothetical protein PVJ57_17540 [Phycisphaerae bacterium]